MIPFNAPLSPEAQIILHFCQGCGMPYPVQNVSLINTILPQKHDEPEQGLFFQTCERCSLNKVTHISISHTHEGDHISIEAEAQCVPVDVSLVEWKKIQEEGSVITDDDALGFHGFLAQSDAASGLIPRFTIKSERPADVTIHPSADTQDGTLQMFGGWGDFRDPDWE